MAKYIEREAILDLLKNKYQDMQQCQQAITRVSNML